MKVKGNRTVCGELFGTFSGVVECDDLGTGWMKAEAIGIEISMNLSVGRLGREATFAKEVECDFGLGNE